MAMGRPQRKEDLLKQIIDWTKRQSPKTAHEAQELNDFANKAMKELNDLYAAQQAQYDAQRYHMMQAAAKPIYAGQLLQQVHPGSVSPIGQPLGMTWTCEICGATRDDKDINVSSIRINFGNGGSMDRNIRHCKEQVACIGAAQVKLEEWKKSQGMIVISGNGGGSPGTGGGGTNGIVGSLGTV